MKRFIFFFYLLIATLLTSLATESDVLTDKILDVNYKMAYNKFGHDKPANYKSEHRIMPDDFQSEIHRAQGQNFDFKYDGICYKIISENEVSVTYDENMDLDENGSNYYGNIIIPSTVINGENTYTVTEIGNYAFAGCSNLISVQLPNTVIAIQPWAFIGSSITSIDIPNSVQMIGKMAFYACTSLQDVTLPEGLTKINEYLFGYCYSLKNIHLPSTLRYIGTDPFYYCDSLENIYIPNIESWLQIDFSYIFSNPMCYAKNLIADGKEVVDLISPESITEIYPFAFYGYYNLKSLVIHDKVTSIGHESFSYTGLEQVNFGKSLTEIPHWTFSCCENLTNFTLPESLKTIGFGAFFDCKSLTSVSIPDQVTEIGNYAFEECRGLKYVQLGNGITQLYRETFANCESLVDIRWNENITAIGDYALYGCKSLPYLLDLPDNIKSIGNYAFSHCYSLTEVITPTNLETIGEAAFWDCRGLNKVTIPSASASIIGKYSFVNCTALTDVELSNSITSIGDSAFLDCSKLTSIVIPNSVTEISKGTFRNCI